MLWEQAPSLQAGGLVPSALVLSLEAAAVEKLWGQYLICVTFSPPPQTAPKSCFLVVFKQLESIFVAY